jgi:hypothetical protein
MASKSSSGANLENLVKAGSLHAEASNLVGVVESLRASVHDWLKKHRPDLA